MENVVLQCLSMRSILQLQMHDNQSFNGAMEELVLRNSGDTTKFKKKGRENNINTINI